MQPLGPFARAFVAANRLFGASMLIGGVYLLLVSAWRLLRGTMFWSQSYVVVLFGIAMVLAGIVYLRAPLFRRPREPGGRTRAQDDQQGGS